MKPGIRTERAIKKWLALPKNLRSAEIKESTIILFETKEGTHWPVGSQRHQIARFTLDSLITKRYPKKRKKVTK